jgi:glycosyltransferase involved in cell wall biosynthesis
LYLIPGVVGGTETYAAGLLEGFARVARDDEFIVFVNREAANWPLPVAGNIRRVVCPISAQQRVGRYAFEQLQFPRWLARYQVHLVHSLGYVSPVWAPCPAVVTAPDANFVAFGAQMSLQKRLALAFFVRQSVRRASRVITISHFSAAELTAALKVPRDRITVTYLAPRVSLARQRVHPAPAGRPAEPYIIAFGSTTANKNIPRLLEAFHLAREQHGVSHQLVLIGHLPPGLLVHADPAVRVTGYVDEMCLAEWLRGADALVFPSTYEGFGLPVLEAMAAGVPVACSNRAALPEVAGQAALYFDPLAVDDMAATIARLARDPALQAELRQKGYENLKRFSWDQTALATLDVYHAVLAQAGRPAGESPSPVGAEPPQPA